MHAHHSHLLRPSTGGEGLKTIHTRCVRFSVTSTIYDASSTRFQRTNRTITLIRYQFLYRSLHCTLLLTNTEPRCNRFSSSIDRKNIMANVTHLFHVHTSHIIRELFSAMNGRIDELHYNEHRCMF